jgi:hypothetical protein
MKEKVMDKRVYFNRQTAGSTGFFPLQIPRFLFSSDTPAYAELSKMSNNAKILYALMLDRLGANDMGINFLDNPWHNDKKLSVKLSGGYDEHGNAYVHYNLHEIMEHLSVQLDDALQAVGELQENVLVKIVSIENSLRLKFYPLSLALT